MGKSVLIIIFEWLAIFLLAAGLAASVFNLRKRGPITKIVLVAFCAIVPLIPFCGLTVTEYFLTIVGRLSITSMVLLSVAVFDSFGRRDLFQKRERTLLLGLIVIGGLMVFPESFGFDQLNGYQLGFGSVIFAIGLMLLSLGFVLLRMYVAAAAIILSVGAFDLHLLVSSNLWDYLFDPLLAIYACVVLVWLVGRRIFAKRAASGP